MGDKKTKDGATEGGRWNTEDESRKKMNERWKAKDGRRQKTEDARCKMGYGRWKMEDEKRNTAKQKECMPKQR